MLYRFYHRQYILEKYLPPGFTLQVGWKYRFSQNGHGIVQEICYNGVENVIEVHLGEVSGVDPDWRQHDAA